MAIFEQTVHVGARREQAWVLLGERFGDLTSWAGLPGTVTLEPPGPVAVGSTRLIQVPRLGTLRETVVVFEPPRHLAYEVHGLPGLVREVRSDWFIEEEGDGCRVRFRSARQAGWGPMGRLVDWLASDAIERTLSRLPRRLKRHLESAAALD